MPFLHLQWHQYQLCQPITSFTHIDVVGTSLYCAITVRPIAMSHPYYYVADHWPPQLAVWGWVMPYHCLWQMPIPISSRPGWKWEGHFWFSICGYAVALYTQNTLIWLYLWCEMWIIYIVGIHQMAVTLLSIVYKVPDLRFTMHHYNAR